MPGWFTAHFRSGRPPTAAVAPTSTAAVAYATGWSRPLPDIATLTWPGSRDRARRRCSRLGFRRYRPAHRPGWGRHQRGDQNPLDSSPTISRWRISTTSCDYKPRQSVRPPPHADPRLPGLKPGRTRYGRIPQVRGEWPPIHSIVSHAVRQASVSPARPSAGSPYRGHSPSAITVVNLLLTHGGTLSDNDQVLIGNRLSLQAAHENVNQDPLCLVVT